MMAIPKPKPHQADEQPEEEIRQPGLADMVDDPELLAELKAWEEASIQDFLRLEESLDDEAG